VPSAGERLAGFRREYEAVRERGNARDTARARNSWGLAAYERAEALVAVAEAEDRKRTERLGDPGPGADELSSPSYGGRPSAGQAGGARVVGSAEAGADDLASAHGHHDACWRDHGEICRSSDPAAAEQARDLWRDAFFAWIQVLVASEAAQDE